MARKREDHSNEYYFNKINKEDLSGSDVKKILDFSDDFFNDSIIRFREIFKKKLSGYSFKKENSNRYDLKKEWNGLFLALLQSLQYHPNYNRHKDKKHYSFEGLYQYNQKLVEGVNKYLDNDLKEFIKWHPAYKAVQEQVSLFQDLENNLEEIIFYINTMPDIAKVEGLIELNKYLGSIKAHIIYCYTDYLTRNSIHENNISKEKSAIKNIAFSQNLEGLLLEILVKLIGKEITIEDLNNTKEGNLISNDILTDLDYISKLKLEYLEVKEKIKNSSENKKIIQKVKAVLDENNQNEKLLIMWLEQALVNMKLNLLEDPELKGRLKVMDTILSNYDASKGLRNLNTGGGIKKINDIDN
ncbi:hypothetical protein HBE96_21905 [Clostridium sp. P21]|uniref:Uncharacterized protein n=1 Tax=Clostridium muellerianum TaxID=2716538 RepID=A0A7Y0EKT2_9CLOT|nr:hypothetical protein [Clostridium muellerianum]NMM65242.1 hypothetical protein [Clostridium muellerianum]